LLAFPAFTSKNLLDGAIKLALGWPGFCFLSPQYYARLPRFNSNPSCGAAMKHVDVAIGVITRGERLLICHRLPDGPLGGMWEFPGGKCESGESPQEAIHRELREELGITVKLELAFPPIDHDYPTFSVTLHPFLCRHRDGEPRALACADMRWVLPDELRHYTFPPANDALVARLSNMLQETQV
jgi:mutator protein MutT